MSSIEEYSCQYTDQIQRKHKSWHDGKLRYSLRNNRFTLYSIEDTPRVLSNAFVTSSKDIQNYLSPQGFNHDVHHIFGRYLIIVNEVISDSGSDVKAHSEPPVQTQKGSVPVLRGIAGSKPLVRSQRTGVDPLALKMNRRFIPPRLLKKQPTKKREYNRPSVREPRFIESKRIKEREKIRKINHEPINLSGEKSFNDKTKLRVCPE